MEMTINNYETHTNRNANLKALTLAMITIISVLIASCCTVFCIDNFEGEKRAWTQEERTAVVEEIKTSVRNTAAVAVYRIAGPEAARVILEGSGGSLKEVAKTVYTSYVRVTAKNNSVMRSIISTIENFSDI